MQREKNIIYYLTVGLFLLPIIVWQNSVYPFVAPKAFLLQIFSLLILVVWLIALLSNWRFLKPRFSWLSLSVLLFYVAIFIASIFSENFNRSLWSRTERMTGLVIMCHYGILFLVWRSVFSKEQWYKLWQWFVGIGMVAPLIAMLQVFNSRLLLNAGAARMSSTLGNPIFLAGFAGFLFFSSLIFYYNTKTKLKYLWLIEMVVSLITIFTSQTRGDLVGLYGGLIFLLIFLAKDLDWQGQRKIFLSVLSVLVIAPIILISFRNFSFIKNIPILNRFVTTPLSEASGGSRLLMWKTAVVGWEQKPLLGWGWENYYDLFNKNYLPEFFGRTEDWQDNAHSVFFNLLATTGIVGLSLYLFIYFYAFYLIFKNYKQKNKNERFLFLGLGAFWLSHFIRNLFVFEDLSSYLVFFWLLAGIDLYNNNVSNTDLKTKNNIGANNHEKYLGSLKVFFGPLLKFLFISVLIFLSCLYLFRFVYLPAKADYYAAQAVKKSMVDFKGAVEFHRKAVQILNPYRPDIAFEFGQFILSWISAHPDFVVSSHRPLAREMYNFGVGAIQSFISDYPTDTRGGKLLGTVYVDGYKFWKDPVYLNEAEKIYKYYLSTSPSRPALTFGLATVKMLQGKHDEALKITADFIIRFPSYPSSYWMQSIIYGHKNDNLSAFNSAKKALELGYRFNSDELDAVFDLFSLYSSINLLEDSIVKIIMDKDEKQNLHLIDKYIDYLNKTNRREEANNFKLKFNR